MHARIGTPKQRTIDPGGALGKRVAAILLSVILAVQPLGTAFAQESTQSAEDESIVVVEDRAALDETGDVEESEALVTESEEAEAGEVEATETETEDDEALASAATAEYSAYLTFSDAGITESSAGSGYSISGTTLTISAAGTYRLGGSCSEGAVIVSASDVVVELDGLTLASSSTAPLIVKKTCTGVCIHLVDGTSSTITNNEDPTNEDSTDTTVADAFEGACIKAKTDSSVTFCGGGNLTCVANTKNGIKGGANASLTFNTTGTVTISGSYSGYATSAGAVNNGIASDGSLTFNAGTYVVAAANDGIKAVPDSDDTTSAGDITINGGTFDIDVDGDGIQAEHNLTINAGTFDIKTMSGYSTSGFDEDTMSCKGIKASGDREDIENTITINGGDFTINTIDDAVHSDMYVLIYAGSFDIYTGDDGMHADTTLTLGADGGLERDPDVYISSSYEGLEAGTIYMYSGRFYVTASDDGVNAAGGSSSGTDTGGPGNDGFRPGGGGPGNTGSTGSSDYNIYIYGGELYVNCDGDGLDSNGGLYLYGGRQAVFSMKTGGDNSAIDCDGTVLIDGATIITAGTAGMDGSAQSSWFGSSQKYKAASSSYSANTVLNAKASSTIMMSYKLPKAVNYVMASWPSSVSSTAPTFAAASSLTSCKSSSWEHNWNSGSTSEGVTTYTCSDCDATEQQTVTTSATVADCDHTVEESEAVTQYTATFSIVDADGATSSGATINIYYTQDYEEADETNVTTAVARDSDTGEVDVSGSGQINFTVVPAEGYTVDEVSVEGSYKNLKGPSDTGVTNTYRITKVAGDLTVTVTVSACAHENVTGPTWTWSDDCTTATAAFECSDCGNTVTVDATITSELTDASTITFTATVELNGTTYADTQTAAPFTGTFSIVDTDGNTSTNATINVYYTQDYAAASETGVTTTVARDGDTGDPVRSGGQINFAVEPADGYTVSNVAATSGTYKNIKGPSDTGAANTYRLTKVSADTTITVTLTQCDHESLSDPTWTWSDDYTTATAAFTCEDCGSTVYYAASGDDITSSLDTSASTMTYTATLTVNDTEYSDTQTVAVYPVQFDAVNATIDVYYTQDYTSADETGVQTAVARDGDSGAILTDGTGQVNFLVTPADGYQIDSVTADANYKNLKDPTDTGTENVYRLTKVTGIVNVTVATSTMSNTVTFDANGHGTTPSAQTVEYGKTATQPDALSETGYVFGGWYTDSSCEDSYVFDFTTAIYEDLTLYAKWTEATYTVSYDANGGSGTIGSSTVAYGATVTLPDGSSLTAPEDGLTFSCWCTSSDGTGACYAGNATATITDDTTFYAIWANSSTDTYTITAAEATGGTLSAEPETQTAGGDVTVTATPDTGYQLTAIAYTANDVTVTVWTGEATEETAASFAMPAGDTTVSATFEKISYAITTSVVDADGETIGGAELTANPSTASCGDSVTLSLALDEGDAASYEFVKWNVISGDVTISDNGDGTYSFVMPASDVEIQAVCELACTEIEVPTGKSLTYTGAEQTGVAAGEGYTLDGTTSATDAGSYTATATLEDGYVWSDGTSDAKTISWEIAQAASTIELADNVEAYTGSTVSYTGTVTKTGSSGEVSYAYYSDEDCTKTATPKKPGVYYVKATLAADANYAEATSAAAKLTVRFLDVPESHEYFSDVHAAASLGIVNGYSGSKLGYFGPEDSLQRGQVAVMLWNLAGKPAAGSSAKSFKDVSSSAYYAKAVAWASRVGVVNGYSGKKAGYFGPTDNVTHEQLCVMIRNYAKAVAGISTKGSASEYAGFSDADDVSSWAVASVGWCFANELTTGFDGLIDPQGEATRAETASMAYQLYLLIEG